MLKARSALPQKKVNAKKSPAVKSWTFYLMSSISWMISLALFQVGLLPSLQHRSIINFSESSEN
jgi:hypothetical protein